jgi:hypothetical protein
MCRRQRKTLTFRAILFRDEADFVPQAAFHQIKTVLLTFLKSKW